MKRTGQTKSPPKRLTTPQIFGQQRRHPSVSSDAPSALARAARLICLVSLVRMHPHRLFLKKAT
jgi:hypothetical protein